jgi:transposase-like protein
MAKHTDPILKAEILQAIKDGMSIVDASAKYHVSDNTLYAWLRVQADNTGTSALEIAKLRKENQELKEIIGLFALKEKRAEKNRYGP